MPAAAKKTLSKEAFYPFPPEVVWAALTRGEALAQWLMPNTFPAEPRIGSRFEFRVDPMPMLPGGTQCEIVEFDPPRRMAWTWKIARKPGKRELSPMLIEWDLSAEPGGTRLRFRQSRMGGLPWIFKLMMNFGWNTMINRWLPQVLGAFSAETSGQLVYHRLAKPGNRGHHSTKTLPPEFFK